jgi:H+/Cl- antiporter ClcA
MPADKPPAHALLPHLLKWLLLATAVGLLAGSASALFLFALYAATATREAHRWLVLLLPLAGFAVAWVYLQVGRRVEAGNNLLIDEIHDPQNVIPLRMAPLILVSTVVSHLFGASVGREGTAVQMGGALADQVARVFRVSREDRRILLMAGISAGFASVFGTPLAGAVFALEVLVLRPMGRLRPDALFACAVAAVVGHHTALLWGVEHVHGSAGAVPPLSLWGLAAVLLAGGAFGLAGRVFASATHHLQAFAQRHVAYSPLRPLIGGALFAAAVFALDGWRYTGLGLPLIADAFEHALPPWEFAAKLLATVVSLGSGFKGGEVTPLFAIGAALGNALAPLLHLPVALLAALGFVAVFAGAANTPLACTLMAMELFGADIGVHALLACVLSYACSGPNGIYRGQRARPEG